MTAQTNQPAKFLVPFAQNDSSRVELPVTTSDATRASQSLGFPPATMQPPEAGGVPPQGEDFNGALNQVARIAWWMMLGGEFAFDNAFATATQIGGYPKGAVLQGADFLGNWISAVDNNTVNPDTSTDPAGGGYVPGYQYGVTALTGLTGGTVTLTNAQAAKGALTLAGTLTGALTVVVPTWLKDWTVTNNTTGAFAAVIKTAAGTGIAIPQNGAPTEVSGDGTNIVQPPQNIATATQPAHALSLGQATGRLLRVTQYTGGTFTWTRGAGTTALRVRAQGTGAAGGGAPATGAGQVSVGSGGGAGATAEAWITGGAVPASATVTAPVGPSGTAGSVGSNGATASFGSLLTAPGGVGGGTAGPSNPPYPPVSVGNSAAPSGGNVINTAGAGGGYAFAIATNAVSAGIGANSLLGAGGQAVSTGVNGAAAPGFGGGGGGTSQGPSAGALTGGKGGDAVVIVEEYGSV